MDIAIVGYGKMGRFYDALMPARYVVDVFPLPHRVCFANVEEFVAFGQPVDLVVVASHTRTHYPICKRLLLSGYDVLVEKPVSLSFGEAKELEDIAEEQGAVLYQSTLERYNPLIKFLRKNIPVGEIERVESFRFGKRPGHALDEDAKFDLGIHDVDLWFYLYDGCVPWRVHAGYGAPRREIQVFLKAGECIRFDLLNKVIEFGQRTLDCSKASQNNPILEMLLDLAFQREAMNEPWSREIAILERSPSGVIDLLKN